MHNRKIHLREEELLPPAGSCHLCGRRDVRRAGRLQRSPDVNLMECRSCGVVSADRLPREDVLEKYYEAYYSEGEVWTISDPEGTSRHLFRKIRRDRGPRGGPLRILDFGGGDGTIAILLGLKLVKAGQAPDAEVTLVDLNARDRPIPAGVRFRWHRRLEEVPASARFHVVIASGVLEHVHRPNELLSALLLRLEPGGFFYARTPFMIVFHRVFSFLHLPSPIPYPGHLHDMGREYWDRVLATLKLEDEFLLMSSTTASVETRLLSRRWVLAALSYLLKAPSRIPFLRGHYDFVGGWEAFIRRRTARSSPAP